MKMNKGLKILLALASATLLLSGCGQQRARQSATQHVKRAPAKESRIVRHNCPDRQNPIMRKADYREPSELGAYPRYLTAHDKIVVSIPRQRAYIVRHGKTIYTMYCSTGSHNRTPSGHYRIQPEHGDWFYSAREHEGAQYYTSWKGNGTYLFHATPANREHQVFKNVAKDLGKKPSSHGCIHLTVPDAHYIETHAKVGMPVIIER